MKNSNLLINLVLLLTPIMFGGGIFGIGYHFGIRTAPINSEQALLNSEETHSLEERRKLRTTHMRNYYKMGATLGDLAPSSDQQSELAKAYKDVEKARRDLHGYTANGMVAPAPFVGCVPAPGSHASAEINSLQFRNQKELSIPKPSGLKRIILTGGSTAYGMGAPENEKTITGYLERELKKHFENIEVINAANNAWASTQERILIENKLSALDPDLVISFSGNNDVHWGFLKENVMWFRTYCEKFYWALLHHAHSDTEFGPLIDTVHQLQEAVAPEVVAHRLLKNAEIARFALKQEKIPYLFVLQPTLTVSEKELSPREQDILEKRVEPERKTYFRESYREIKQTFNDREGSILQFLDLSNLFDSNKVDEEIFLDSYHFGDRGNEMIAQAMVPEILKQLNSSKPPLRKALYLKSQQDYQSEKMRTTQSIKMANQSDRLAINAFGPTIPGAGKECNKNTPVNIWMQTSYISPELQIIINDLPHETVVGKEAITTTIQTSINDAKQFKIKVFDTRNSVVSKHVTIENGCSAD